MNDPILITERYWRNSPLSIARHYGGITYNGKHYSIVNKDGITLAELSNPGSVHYVGDAMAIKPGEPADLVLDGWLTAYRLLGRERLIQLIKEGKTLKDVESIAKLVP